MTKLVLLTTTYGPDFECFRELHASVLRHTSEDVEHHIIVPESDVALFRQIQSSRLKIGTTRDYLPKTFVSISPLSDAISRLRMPFLSRRLSTGGGELFVNIRKPWPPIRGWIVQQIVKLAAVGRMEADVVVTLDSDVALIRPVSSSHFVRNGAVRFYRKPDAVHGAMVRHLAWHRGALRLLGLPPSSRPLASDYVSSLIAWDPDIVRRLQSRISQTSGRDWASTLASELHFSECMIYGTYIDSLGSEQHRSFSASTPLCHSHWAASPLDRHDIGDFLQGIEAQDLAVLVQSTSNTPLETRRAIVSAAEEHSRQMH